MSNVSPIPRRTQRVPGRIRGHRLGLPKENHFWALPSTDGSPTENGTLPNTPETIETWAVSLRQRFPRHPWHWLSNRSAVP